MISPAVNTAKEIAEMIGVYYKELRKQGVGRHLAASLTVDYANMLLAVMKVAGTQKQN